MIHTNVGTDTVWGYTGEILYTVWAAWATVNTWEVNGGVDGCTRGHRGVNQVWIFQPEPGGEGARVRASERHPLVVSQPPGRGHHGAEVSQVCQRLATAEEAQAVCAEVAAKQRDSESGQCRCQSAI